METPRRAIRLFEPAGIRLALGALCLCAFPFGGLAAERAVVNELRVKAEYIVRFAQYIEWPKGVFAAAESPIRIGVLRTDPLSAVLLRAVKGKKVGRRLFQVEMIDSEDELDGLHVVYMGGLALWRQEKLIENTRTKPVLTVGDVPDFARKGGRITFVTVDRQLRFEVNLASARAAGFKVSSKLLSVAEKVHQK